MFFHKFVVDITASHLHLLLLLWRNVVENCFLRFVFSFEWLIHFNGTASQQLQQHEMLIGNMALSVNVMIIVVPLLPLSLLWLLLLWSLWLVFV